MVSVKLLAIGLTVYLKDQLMGCYSNEYKIHIGTAQSMKLGHL